MENAAERSTPPRVRYGSYTDSDSEELAVQIKATDFNGESWDGCPFSATPQWLQDAVKNLVLSPHTRGHTDYAEWDVVLAKGVTSATPGDWIVRRENGELSVVADADAFVLINLRPPVDGEPERK